MLEGNGYEPLAEIEISLTDSNTRESIYCLCSRVIIDLDSNNCDPEEEEICEIKKDFSEGSKNKPKPLDCELTGEESVVRFFNSSTESPPPVRNLRKKEHEEAVSCYCSASHYSTDEHDSLRESSVLHHSDSGADLSECSRDLDWEKYWNANGERLVWESWISRYGGHIDPNYVHPLNEANQGEETSFFIQINEENQTSDKTSFKGLLDDFKENNSDLNNILQKREDNILPPKICIEDEEELYRRRLSDISESVKSESVKSEESNCDEEERFRLSGESRCSGSSVPLTATTDSMTNVTRMTLSSSDSSYGAEDSSARSSSLLSSSDSASSGDQHWQMWQQVWLEHFNEQYLVHYQAFTEKYHKSDVVMEEEIDNIAVNVVGKADEKLDCNEVVEHNDIADDKVYNIDDVVVGDLPVDGKKKLRKRRKNSSFRNGKSLYDRKFIDSVGYILQNLHTMSVMPDNLIQEEDEMDNSKLQNMTSDSVLDSSEIVTITDSNTPLDIDVESNVSFNQPNEQVILESNLNTLCENQKFDNEDKLSALVGKELMDEKCCEVISDPSRSENFNLESTEEDNRKIRNTLKRSHGSDIDEASVDKVKSAFDLMGFVFEPDDGTSKKQICKGDVYYKKRHIRYQNRGLRLANIHKNTNKHIYFDDDDDDDMTSNNTLEKVQEFLKANDNNDLEKNKESLDTIDFIASETITFLKKENFNINDENDLMPIKNEVEEFSEKDDSSDDDIFFSAEENSDFDLVIAKKDTKSKTQKAKRKKKKQFKKKTQESVQWPEEFETNKKLRKYWHKRYALFSRFDEGIKLDEESWYSVTPEKVSAHIAERSRCDIIIDGFCGAGGNTIQFAFTCERVIAIDIDSTKIELARHNAQIYGVEDRIEFIVGDFFKLAPTLKSDVVFLSPPWGGPGYTKNSSFNLCDMKPIDGSEIYKIASGISENIVFYLPRNINVHTIVECAGSNGSVEVEQNFLGKSLIAVTAYFGELIHEG